MKKLNLLLATTAMLSMGAMAANAIDNASTTLHTKVGLLRPLAAEEVMPLDFGIFVAKNNGVYVIDTNGGRGEESTLAQIEGHSKGVIKISGDLFDELGILDETDQQSAIAGIRSAIENVNLLTFSNITPLEDNGITCGTIDSTSLTQVNTLAYDGSYVLVSIGGKLTLDSNIETSIATAKRGLACEGTMLATVVVPADD